jgi:solute carrier family 35 protein C2
MHRHCPELTNPVDTLFHVAPSMTITLLPFAIVIEGSRLYSSHLLFHPATGPITIALIIMGSCIAFGLVMSEFLLVHSTSSVTLSVAGIFKEICTISVAVLVSGENLTAMNVAGLIMSIIGIAYYNILKFRGVILSGGHGRGSQGYLKVPSDSRDSRERERETSPSPTHHDMTELKVIK